MNIGVLGTGVVALTLASGLIRLGHKVSLGTRDPQASAAREPVAAFQAAHKDALLVTFAQAAEAEFLINATNGAGSRAALMTAGPERLHGKVLLDAANPLDFSRGFPPSLSISNTGSLAEELQAAHPNLRVVKALNVVTAAVMIEPGLVPGGQPSMLIAGNDAQAKAAVSDLLRAFGWTDILDLGDLKAARTLEMLVPAWLVLSQTLGTYNFGFKVQR